jgi:hypothetical protein
MIIPLIGPLIKLVLIGIRKQLYGVSKTIVFGTLKLAVSFEMRFWERIIPNTNLNIGTSKRRMIRNGYNN